MLGRSRPVENDVVGRRENNGAGKPALVCQIIHVGLQLLANAVIVRDCGGR